MPLQFEDVDSERSAEYSVTITLITNDPDLCAMALDNVQREVTNRREAAKVNGYGGFAATVEVAQASLVKTWRNVSRVEDF
jgi:hypothetical protein